MKVIAQIILFAFFISSCQTTGSIMNFGPKTSNEILESEKVADHEEYSRPRIDVAIPIFDPGIP